MKTHKDLSSAVVGRFYRVPCAKLVSNWDIRYIPVLGPLHSDKQFSVDFEHYHIDGRFALEGELWSLGVNPDGTTNHLIGTGKNGLYEFAGIEEKLRKCRRLTTGIIPPDRSQAVTTDDKRPELYWSWYDSMVGKSCKGRKCPHLGTQMLEVDGKLVCPLHGLRGTVDTEVISRVS